MNLFTAKKLTALRKHFSLSQEALAEKIGVSRQAISKWERGEASPDTDNLLMLSSLYSVSIDDILGDKSAEEIIGALTEKEQKAQAAAPEKQTAATEAPEGKTAPQNNFYADAPREKEQSSAAADLVALGKKMLRIPYFLAAIILFLVIGFSSGLWHPAWMLFLTIPAYYLTAWAFLSKTKKGMLLKLPVYLYTVILFLIMGFTASLWHPMWLLFLLIPAYYWYVATMKK